VSIEKTPSGLFDTLLPLGLAAYPDRAREINASIGFNIEGADGGFWVLDCTKSPPKVTKNPAEQPSCTIEMSSEDFVTIMQDHTKSLDLYFENKLRITGDQSVALRLGLFFEITRPNPGPDQV
jgi:alkyl sulfatase BDS1-like metallo-beta-lactamase superfamily hydrolase